MSEFKKIKPEAFNKSLFQIIGNEWMLVAAKNGDKVNAMTASWGGLGVMWGKNVAYVVIRPQRYTKEFVEYSEGFSLTFFKDDYKKMLGYMGRVSGRDEDKIKVSDLTCKDNENIPYFEEANIAIFCKKLYAQDLKENSFIDKSLTEKWYPQSDYHTLYIAEVTDIFIKE